ncbi:MAG: Phosphomannomutase [Myxococcaceae bacterium]|nr:Phosphomannomutase [Myxococcaceae bacterium]
MTIRLSFGTAGIRAQLGPGLDQINLYTVGAVSHAVCAYLLETFPGATGRGICVAFDGRTDSDVFAREVVRIARAYGYRVRAFETPTPTPVLAFCTRFYGAVAGLMITASHNPPADNGIKLYLEGGAQVLAPHDALIAQRIATFEPAAERALSTPEGVLDLLGARDIEAYLDTITKLVERSSAPLPRFAYSALNGVGTAVTRRLFARLGAHDALEVAAEAEPRADLGGLASPNPEHTSALAGVLELARSAAVEVAFVHDPDADRLAVIARDRHGQLRPLSGDEVGALIGDFVLAESADPSRALLLSTLVSGELLERIARAKRSRFERTPTGFKWIASRARELERSDGVHFLFGYEEAIGYAFGDIADDKDGIAALGVLLELTRRLHAQGQSLCGRLDALAREHGLFVTRQRTLPRAAASVPEHDLMARLRRLEPESLLGAGTTRVDYAEEPAGIELLVFRGPNATRLCVRPSGTEPKLKLYLHAGVAVAADLDAAEAAAQGLLDQLEQRIAAL